MSRQIINRELYPIDRLEFGAGQAWLDEVRNQLHRVTLVEGKRQRLQAILGYSTRPNMLGNRESSILHYGPRVAKIEANSPRYP